MSDALDQARTVAIAALNRCHEKHGIKKIENCDFCTSLAAEMTIARHFEPIFKEVHEARDEIRQWQGIGNYLIRLLDHEGDGVVMVPRGIEEKVRYLMGTPVSDRQNPWGEDGRNPGRDCSEKVRPKSTFGTDLPPLAAPNDRPCGHAEHFKKEPGECPKCGEIGGYRELADRSETAANRQGDCCHEWCLICNPQKPVVDEQEPIKCAYWSCVDRVLTDYPYREHWSDCELCQAVDPDCTAAATNQERDDA